MSQQEWTVEFYKVQGVDNASIWYNENYYKCHPSYLETADYLLWPDTLSWVPCCILYISNDNKRIVVGYTNFYTTGGDDYYQIPLINDNWNMIRIYTLDKTENSIKILPRSWKYVGPLTSGHIIDITSDVEYKGTHPQIIGFDDSGNIKSIAATGYFDWKSLIAHVIHVSPFGAIASFGEAVARYRTVQAEVEATQNKVQITRNLDYYAKMVNDTVNIILKFIDECPKTHDEQYCEEVAKMLMGQLPNLQGLATNYNKIIGADPDQDDISWKDVLYEGIKAMKYVLPLIGLMILMVKFNIFKYIFDMMKEVTHR